MAQKFVAREHELLIKQVDDAVAAQGLHGDEKDWYYSSKDDEFDRLCNTFPRIVYGSTLVTACSFFESSLVDLCKAFDRDSELVKVKPWRDLSDKGGGVKNAADFLKANFKIELSRHPHWETIIDYFKIRNCVAHANGDVSLMRGGEVEGAVKCHEGDGISVDVDNRLKFGLEFVSTVIDQLAALWPRLHAACSKDEVLGPRYWPCSLGGP